VVIQNLGDKLARLVDCDVYLQLEAEWDSDLNSNKASKFDDIIDAGWERQMEER
jgi:hypothetical protein